MNESNIERFSKRYVKGSSSFDDYLDTEGNNSNITECYVYENMRIMNSGSVVKSFNSVGTKASLNEIIKFCKLNWKDCAWAYRDTLPSF